MILVTLINCLLHEISRDAARVMTLELCIFQKRYILAYPITRGDKHVSVHLCIWSSSSTLSFLDPKLTNEMRPLTRNLASRQLTGYVCNSCTRQLGRQRRSYASTPSSTPDVYDVVCVGGGPAGLSLLAALRKYIP